MQFQMSPYVINTGALFDQFTHSLHTLESVCCVFIVLLYVCNARNCT